MTTGEPKDLVWMGSSREDLRRFPDDVTQILGFALYEAQKGGKHVDAKPLKGFKGASVLEIARRLEGDTYRAVYTVRLGDKVYVLHAFQKKSKRGAETPKREMDLVRRRLEAARELHEQGG